jgi:hypothetical protein
MRIKSTVRFDLEPPRFPIAGTASSMGHRDDFNRLIGHTVNYGVRKAAQQVFSCAVQMPRPPLWIAANFTKRRDRSLP